MKAIQVYPNDINAEFTIGSYPRQVVAERDYGNIGIFAFVTRSFSIYKSKVEKTYTIEVWGYDSDGHLTELQELGYNNLKELKKAYKTFKY